MNPPIADLLKTLDALEAAHGDLCAALDAQQAAMRRFDPAAIAEAARRQEAIHRRVLRLEQERRRRTAPVAKALGLPTTATLAQIAARLPQQQEDLLRRRAALRAAAEAAVRKSGACARIAGGVLGHLNLALRLLTQSTTYRKTGGFDLPPPRRRLEALA